MTNRDRLIVALNTDLNAAVKEMERLVRNPLYAYIDGEKYLVSEDEDPVHFLAHRGECFLLPSEYEIVASRENASIEITDAYRELYREEHKKKGFILEDNLVMFGGLYTFVYVPDIGKVVKTPSKNIRRIGKRG
jgi:hypothetical protein